MADDTPGGLVEATEELYGLDPKDFVPARNELARPRPVYGKPTSG